MGLNYTSITVKGPTQDQLVRYFAERDRPAWISVTSNAITTIFDKDFNRGGVVWRRFEVPAQYRRGETAWEPLATNLAQHFHCPTFAVEIYDSDVFYYQLYAAGRVIDEYSSPPG